MKLNFTKMNGLGNDFIVIDSRQSAFPLNAQQIQQLAHRRHGIGFDQVLVLESSQDKQADFYYRIFNADGSEVSQCGNGARCLFTYLVEKNISKVKTITVQTHQQRLKLFPDGDSVGVELGIPNFDPSDIPTTLSADNYEYQIQLDNKPCRFTALSVGNPHAVITVKDVDIIEIAHLSQQLQQSSYFPQSVNVGFMQIVDRDNIKLRVYERGAGETLACGSGAAAAAITGILQQKLNSQVHVHARGGSSRVSWDGIGHAVKLYGDTASIYDGVIDLAKLS